MADGVLEMRLVVTAPDFDEALAFYRDVLGLRELGAYHEPGRRVTILDAGHATLELADPPHAAWIDEVEVGRRVAGHVRVAFQVPDTAAATRRLVEGGATLVAEPVETPWHSLNARLEAPGRAAAHAVRAADRERVLRLTGFRDPRSTATMTAPSPAEGESMTAPAQPAATSKAWHALSIEDTLAAQQVDAVKGLSSAEVESPPGQGRAQRVHRPGDRVALARVPSPVRRRDADRPAGRRHPLDLPGQAGADRRDADPADRPQRLPGPQPGGQGRRRGRRAPEDDGRQGARAAGRRAAGDPVPGAGTRGRRVVRGRRPRDRGRPDHLGGHARDRRGGAHRREPARPPRTSTPSPRTRHSATATAWPT